MLVNFLYLKLQPCTGENHGLLTPSSSHVQLDICERVLTFSPDRYKTVWYQVYQNIFNLPTMSIRPTDPQAPTFTFQSSQIAPQASRLTCPQALKLTYPLVPRRTCPHVPQTFMPLSTRPIWHQSYGPLKYPCKPICIYIPSPTCLSGPHAYLPLSPPA